MAAIHLHVINIQVNFKTTVWACTLFQFQSLRLLSSDMLQRHDSIKPCI